MNIQRLRLQDFRNIRACDLAPEAGVNILCGENGQGKTNLVEAIYLLANLSSFRAYSNRKLIRHGAPAARIHGILHTGATEKELAVQLLPVSKTVKVNGKGVARGVDFFGEAAVTLFSPETVKMVRGAPELRRRFLDTALSRVDRGYLLDLKEYRRILEQRNRLLRMVRDGRVSLEALHPWTEQLAERASRILHGRCRYLSELSPVAVEIFQQLQHKESSLRIVYRAALPRSLMAGTPVESLDTAALKARLVDGLGQSERLEIQTGATRLGPHLDDLLLEVSDRPARDFASQGEGRLLALSLALGEARLFERLKGDRPVLLLDDVGSELDQRHQGLLCEQLPDFGQVFLTTTERSVCEKIPTPKALFDVIDGEIALVMGKQK
jgi:DNA replication and repair protein RecF